MKKHVLIVFLFASAHIFAAYQPQSSSLTTTLTSNQIVLGTGTKITTISATAPAASLTYTLPDVGGAANMVLSNGQGTTTTILHGSVAGIPAWGAAVLTTDVSGILPTANGGTGIAFFTAAGPTVARVYTFPDAATTVLTTNSAVTTAQGGTGVATFTANGVLYGNAAGNVLVTAAGANNTLLHGNTGAAPTYSAVALASDVTGTLADGNLSSNIPLKNAANTFTLGPNIFQSGAAGNIALIARAAATPTVSFFAVQDSASIAQFRVDSAGNTQIGSATQNATLNFGNGIDTRKTTISVTAPAVSNTYTIPDVGGAANFALSSGQGTATTLLHGSAAGIPAYGAVVLTTDVSGILPTANGGTGIAYFTAAGPTVARVYTFPDAATTVLTTNSAVTTAQGGTGVATFTANGVLYGNAAGNVLVTAAGANNTLLHGNTGAAPTYSAVSMTADVTGVLPLANGGTNRTDGAAGAFIQTTTLTSGVSITTTANTRTIRIRVQGGGGGGGGAATAANQNAAAGGGSAGGYAEKTFTVTGSTAYTYAIGAAGAAGAAGNNAGGAGGNSTFAVGATTVTANGGLGGPGGASVAAITFTAGGASPAVSTNGDVNSGGAPGGVGIVGNATLVAVSGAGGSCVFGAGGNSVAAQGAGLAGVGNGAGGSGGVVINGGVATAGGAGLVGIITVDEYR